MDRGEGMCRWGCLVRRWDGQASSAMAWELGLMGRVDVEVGCARVSGGKCGMGWLGLGGCGAEVMGLRFGSN